MTSNLGRVALITGCSEPESLGACTALELVRNGFRVFATARNVPTMAALKAEGCDLLALDVTDSKSIIEAVSELTQATNGRLDILINNAGVAGTAPTLDTDIERMRAMYEVNVFGVLAVTQAFAPMLVKTANKTVDGKKPDHSVILTVGSIGSRSFPWMGAYGSSKAAVQNISDTLRLEMRNLNVKVITLELAQVRTAMTLQQKGFSLMSTERSGFYPNYDEWKTASYGAAVKRFETVVMRAPEAAAQVVELVLKKNPPGKAWIGTSAWMFAWVWNLLPLWFRENLVVKMVQSDRIGKAKLD